LRDPEVNVILKDFVKPHFVVAGEVALPELLIYEAGDCGSSYRDERRLQGSSNRRGVVLLRRVDKDYAEVKVLDLKKLMSPSISGGHPDPT
jgi:hypothetical protein